MKEEEDIFATAFGFATPVFNWKKYPLDTFHREIIIAKVLDANFKLPSHCACGGKFSAEFFDAQWFWVCNLCRIKFPMAMHRVFYSNQTSVWLMV